MASGRLILALSSFVLAAISCSAPSDTSKASRAAVGESDANGACRGLSVANRDIGGPLGLDVFAEQEVLFDSAADRVLVVGADASRRPTLRRCNADGSACTAHALDPSRGADSGRVVRAAVDRVGGKLLVATEDHAWTNPAIEPWQAPSRLSLFRCNLDGTGCTWLDISTGAGPHTISSTAQLLVDEENGKLLLPDSTCGRILRCNLDGTGCAVVDLAGASGVCGNSWAIDSASQKLVFASVANNAAGPGGGTAPSSISLTRCNLDGTACTTSLAATLAAPVDRVGTVGTSVVVDALRSKLGVVFYDPRVGGNSPLNLARCSLDATGCTTIVLPSSLGGWPPRALIGNDELVVAASTVSNDQRVDPSLLRCTPDGTSCTRTDLRVGDPSLFATPTLAYDAVRSKAVVAIAYVTPKYSWEGAFPAAVFTESRGGPALRQDVGGGLAASRPIASRRSNGIDAASGKVLVVAHAAGPGVVLTRCNADGTGCTGAQARLAIDLLGAVDGVTYLFGPQTTEDGPATPVELVRCASDATTCTASPITGSAPGTHAELDVKHRRILLFDTPYDSSTTTMRRCNLGLDSCSDPIPWPPGSGFELAFDDANDRLVATRGDGAVYLCARDGSGCARHVVSSDDSVFWSPGQLLVDDRSLSIFAMEMERGSGDNVLRAVIHRCKLDATECTRRELGLQGQRSDLFATATLDTRTNHVVVAYTDRAHLLRPAALRCSADGSGCCSLDLGAGLLPRTGVSPFALFDPVSERSLVLTSDETNLGRARLFTMTRGQGGGSDADAGGGSGGPPPGESDAGTTPDGGSSGGGKTW